MGRDFLEHTVKKQPTGPSEEDRRLDQLIEHPQQQDYFDHLSDHDLKALAADIKRNGLRQPIQIMPPDNTAGLPANTILDGHQRRRALQLNGETVARVIVRYDLLTVDAATVERAFLEPNQNRRHLDTLAKARV